MRKYNIPTAEYRIFSSPEEAKAYVVSRKTPLVIKADGLAAGKGVIIAMTSLQALEAIELIMVRKEFGEAGNQVVIESLLQGEEASFMVFTDGDSIVPLSSAQDHKAIFDGDQGPNTGGMGAYSPAPVVSSSVREKIMTKIMIPTIEGMAAEGRKYEGILYAGVMIADGEPWVLEYNARLGDPETQPVLMKLKTDLFPVLEGIAAHTLAGVQLQWDEGHAVCEVMATSGYPGAYSTGKMISGLPAVETMDGIQVFHAGTAWENGHYVTSGGRVLGVTALGGSIDKSIALAYEGVSKISWDGAYYRRDIGSKALKRNQSA
jgi:phosphoribosylamine--glycine ligase